MKKIGVYHGVKDLPASALTLLDSAVPDKPFFISAAWFANLYATVIPAATTRIYCLESTSDDNPDAIAILPMWSRQADTIFSGRHLDAAANYFSPLYSAITRADPLELQQDLTLLAQFISEETPPWSSIALHPMAQTDPIYSAMQAAFSHTGMHVQRYFCFGNWYLPVGGRSYDDYALTLPPKLKNTLARKARQLDKKHPFRIDLIQDDTGLEQAIQDYEHIYRASWKDGEEYPDFIPGLIRTAAQQGCLRLGIATIDGQPAAAQIWLTQNKVASIFKLAYDQKFAALSVGSILTAHMMRHALDVDRVDEVDYLMGDDAYKQDWMSHRRERWGLMAFNPRTLQGRALWYKQLAAQVWKAFRMRFVKRVQPVITLKE